MRILIAESPTGYNPAASALRMEGYHPIVRRCMNSTDYATEFCKSWRRGTGFVNVEADIVPFPGALEILWGCPEPWCVFSYPMPGGSSCDTLGCAKFSAALTREYPSLSLEWEGLDWRYLDGRVMASCARVAGRRHVHKQRVAHAKP